jgi:hypothetical protein
MAFQAAGEVGEKPKACTENTANVLSTGADTDGSPGAGVSDAPWSGSTASSRPPGVGGVEVVSIGGREVYPSDQAPLQQMVVAACLLGLADRQRS